MKNNFVYFSSQIKTKSNKKRIRYNKGLTQGLLFIVFKTKALINFALLVKLRSLTEAFSIFNMT